tara:strand:+ start:5175 stop:6137 length:963 start_codon:yes stop_codon:yes gene_type:complete
MKISKPEEFDRQQDICDDILYTQTMIEKDDCSKYIGNKNSYLKFLEVRLLFDILQLCPNSKARMTKGHRKKGETNKVLINAHMLSVCHISWIGKPDEIDKSNGGSYLNMNDKTITYYRKSDVQYAIFDIKDIWDSILNLVNEKKTAGCDMVLFSNKNLQKYPVYYKSGKKNCSFSVDITNIIKKLIMKHCDCDEHDFENGRTLNAMFQLMNEKNMHDSKDPIDEWVPNCTISHSETNIKQNNENNTQDEDNDIVETPEEFMTNEKWEEIYTVLGLFPLDCKCKEYGKTLYTRCIINGKPRKGIRPKHKADCDKKVSPIIV